MRCRLSFNIARWAQSSVLWLRLCYRRTSLVLFMYRRRLRRIVRRGRLAQLVQALDGSRLSPCGQAHPPCISHISAAHEDSVFRPGMAGRISSPPAAVPYEEKSRAYREQDYKWNDDPDKRLGRHSAAITVHGEVKRMLKEGRLIESSVRYRRVIRGGESIALAFASRRCNLHS